MAKTMLLNHAKKQKELREPSQKTDAAPRPYAGPISPKAPNEVNPNPEAPEPQSPHIPDPRGSTPPNPKNETPATADHLEKPPSSLCLILSYC